MTTKKMQISGHSMSQELELPRRNNLNKVTQHEARYDDCRKSSSQRRFTQDRTNEGNVSSEQTKDQFSPYPNEGNSRSQRRDNHPLHIWPLHSQSKSRPGECHASITEI